MGGTWAQSVKIALQAKVARIYYRGALIRSDTVALEWELNTIGMCGSTLLECDVGLQNVQLTKMAERASDPTGIAIPSSGETTPEYNAVQKSYGEIEAAIIRGPFVCRAGECPGLLPARNSSSPPLEVVLKEIFRDPVNYYSLQYVVATLNVGNRFDKGIGKMETTFQRKDIMHLSI